MPLGLPGLDGLDRVDEHENVERQVIADPPEATDFENDDDDHDGPDARETGG